MLKLIQYAPAFGTRSGSPFCTKVEGLLKMSGQPFETEIWMDPRKAPKGKLPVLRDGNKLVADSTFIRKYLEEKFEHNFDEHLDSQNESIADAFTKLCEEHLYWAIVYSRWVDEPNWQKLKDAYFSQMPGLIRLLAAPQIRKSVIAQLLSQGFGRHSASEVYELGASDIQRVAKFLGNKTYFMGEHLNAVDATIYAFMACILDSDLPGPLKDEALRHENLRSYCNRVEHKLFAS